MTVALENLCRSQGLLYRRANEGLIVATGGQYPEASSYWVRLGLTQREDGVGIFYELPQYDSKEISGLEQFCACISHNLRSGATLAYNDVEYRFFIYGVAERSTLASYLAVLGQDCDTVEPMCKSVSRFGCWSYALIGMAYSDPEEMYQA